MGALQPNTVALFVTCLVENMKPTIAFDTIALLEDAGYAVVVPANQVCCGQPNLNGGDRNNAIATARRVIDEFVRFEYVVIPSGSCGGMLKHHYPQLLAEDSDYRHKSAQLAAKVFELSQFLTEVADYHPAAVSCEPVTYHDACAGLRELDIQSEPRQLLTSAGVQISELEETESCCGFGGTFCVKYPDISAAMAERKVQDVLHTGADTLVMGDLGCMLNIEGKLHRDGHSVRVIHYAELLASGIPASAKVES
ncbi:MAG: L-lactate dehydrogenase complex protein LldE [Candidatus Azotimanducaceae bacterium]|jgi:L-lactate dehydrogenase complex protein LldE